MKPNDGENVEQILFIADGKNIYDIRGAVS